MLVFHATCLVMLLPWFTAMIGLNWTRLCGWRWRLLAMILTLGIMATTVCVPEVLFFAVFGSDYTSDSTLRLGTTVAERRPTGVHGAPPVTVLALHMP